MFTRITLTAILFGTVANVPPALAEASCGPRDGLVSSLKGTYGERPMGAGLRGSSSMFEIWASPDSGTWTILVTDVNGVSCIMATGESWHDMPTIPVHQGEPA